MQGSGHGVLRLGKLLLCVLWPDFQTWRKNSGKNLVLGQCWLNILMEYWGSQFPGELSEHLVRETNSCWLLLFIFCSSESWITFCTWAWLQQNVHCSLCFKRVRPSEWAMSDIVETGKARGLGGWMMLNPFILIQVSCCIGAEQNSRSKNMWQTSRVPWKLGRIQIRCQFFTTVCY